MNLRTIVTRHLDALTFRKVASSEFSPAATFALMGIHALGLAAVLRYFHAPNVLMVSPIVLYLAVGLAALRSRRLFHVETLAPLFFLYGVIAARYVFVRGFDGQVPGYFDDVLPEPHAVVFRIEPIAVAVLLYSTAIWLFQRFQLRVLQVMPALLVFATVIWGISYYVGQRARGVTASDPYAYVQMGVDLATRGTVLHRFPLFAELHRLELAWHPFVHVGYHLPLNELGDAATVWPVGGSVFYAVAYRAFGEEGLYWVHPIFVLLTLVPILLLTNEIFSEEGAVSRWWILALSALVWITSATVTAWGVVTMADAQAAFFSALAIYLAIRFLRHPSKLLSFSSGIALGTAYLVRHTQVLLAPAVALSILAANLQRRSRLRALTLAALGSTLVALPDLIYHQTVFGHWLQPESLELELYTLTAPMHAILLFADRFLAAFEFGWLIPFSLYGAYRLARAYHHIFRVLAFWFTLNFVFHLFYPALRPRDLLSEYIPVILVTAFGMVSFVRVLAHGERGVDKLLAALAILFVLVLPILRVWNTLRLPVEKPRPLFGYLTSTHRASFERVAELTPESAVIAASLNSGALDLYSRRLTVRPGAWSPIERDTFVQAMTRAGRPIFLLEDASEMTQVRLDLQSRYKLHQIALIDVPLFGETDLTKAVLWNLDR